MVTFLGLKFARQNPDIHDFRSGLEMGEQYSPRRYQSWTFRDAVRPVGVETALDPHAGWIDG